MNLQHGSIALKVYGRCYSLGIQHHPLMLQQLFQIVILIFNTLRMLTN